MNKFNLLSFSPFNVLNMVDLTPLLETFKDDKKTASSIIYSFNYKYCSINFSLAWKLRKKFEVKDEGRKQIKREKSWLPWLTIE